MKATLARTFSKTMMMIVGFGFLAFLGSACSSETCYKCTDSDNKTEEYCNKEKDTADAWKALNELAGSKCEKK